MGYDVTKRFQEVARRAEEAKRPKPAAKPAEEPFDADAYPTRPGRNMKKTGDVNLKAIDGLKRAVSSRKDD